MFNDLASNFASRRERRWTKSEKPNNCRAVLSLSLFLSRISSERMREKRTRRDKSALRNVALRSRRSCSRIELRESVEARRRGASRLVLPSPACRKTTHEPTFIGCIKEYYKKAVAINPKMLLRNRSNFSTNSFNGSKFVCLCVDLIHKIYSINNWNMFYMFTIWKVKFDKIIVII